MSTMLKQDSKTGLWYNVTYDEETGEITNDPMAQEEPKPEPPKVTKRGK